MTKRKYAKIELKEGLKISLKILKRLKKRTEIKEYRISVGCFTNLREVGLTFYAEKSNSKKVLSGKTFCIYEHRNSDQIIINGKDGFIAMSGELPYSTNSKWDYLASTSYEKYDEATDLLVKEILKIK